MLSKSQIKIASDFFLGGSKIIFGSIVVGAFLPSTTEIGVSWNSVAGGLLATVIFLLIAIGLPKITIWI